MSPRPRIDHAIARGVGALLCAALLAASAPPWADDWDGLGFLASVDCFDIAHFAPHPPGYPVYVAALRVAHVFARDARVAAYAVAIASALVSALALWAAAERGARARGWVFAVAALVTPLAWRAFTAIGSESLALAFAAIATWALVAARTKTDAPNRSRPRTFSGENDRVTGVVLGAAIGLGLGVRLSWAPLFASLLVLAPRGVRARAVAAAIAATLAWVIPLAAIVGPSRLVALYRVHANGHATTWGGTAIADPGASRVAYLARDLFVDGLGAGPDALGVAIGVVAIALAGYGLRAWRRAGFACARDVAILVVPYFLWIALGQNVRQQPRHALPLVVVIAVLLALAATVSPRARQLGVALALLVAAHTAIDAWQRRTTPPPGEQLVAYARAQPAPVAIFGGPSIRFFESSELAKQAAVLPTYDELGYALTRVDRYPRTILVTSEVEGAPTEPAVAVLCRPPRLDRRGPCLRVVTPSPPALR
ncbi:MAG TPA: DUF2723 domain-containing protein [Labilithrix sp.]